MALIPCPNCGHNVSDRAEKCPRCGKELTPVTQPYNTGESGSNVKRSPGTSPQLQQNYNVANNIREEKKSKVWLWILIGVLAGLGIGVAIWVPLYRHNKELKALELERIEKHRQDSLVAVKAELARIEQLREDSIAKALRLNKAKLSIYDILERSGYNPLSYELVRSNLMSKGYSLELYEKRPILNWYVENPPVPTGDYYEVWKFIFYKNPDDETSSLYEVEGEECTIKIKINDKEAYNEVKKEVYKIKDKLEFYDFGSNEITMGFCFVD